MVIATYDKEGFTICAELSDAIRLFNIKILFSYMHCEKGSSDRNINKSGDPDMLNDLIHLKRDTKPVL